MRVLIGGLSFLFAAAACGPASPVGPVLQPQPTATRPMPGDAGPTCAAPDDGVPLAEGDALLVRTASSGRVELGRWWVACFDSVQVLHTDGTAEPLAAGVRLEVEPFDTSIVAPALPSDCERGGVIGEAMGATSVRVSLAGRGCARVTAALQAVVKPGEPEVRFTSLKLPAGATQPLAIGMQLPAGVPLTTAVTPVWRWMSVRAEPAAIAAVEPMPEGTGAYRFRLRGLQVGTASTVVTYGPPGEERTYRPAVDNVEVLPVGELQHLSGLALGGAGGGCTGINGGAQCRVEPGACVTASATGFFAAGPTTYYRDVTADTAFEIVSGPARLEPGESPKLCAEAAGAIVLRACAATKCAFLGAAAYAASAAPALVVQPGTVSASAARDGYRREKITWCIDVPATVTLPGGSPQPVGESLALSFRATSSHALERVVGAGGLPAPGRPCFSHFLDVYAATTDEVDLEVGWGQVRAPLRVNLTIPPL